MSETQTEAVETSAEETSSKEQAFTELPPDHPLVKTLAAQKEKIKDLAPKAKRLTEIEEAAKSKEEKDAERIAAAEAAVAQVPAQVAEGLKTHLVALHNIESEDSELFLTATEPDLLLKQVERLLGQSGKRQRRNQVAREGDNPSAAPSDEAAFARDFFGG